MFSTKVILNAKRNNKYVTMLIYFPYLIFKFHYLFITFSCKSKFNFCINVNYFSDNQHKLSIFHYQFEININL